MANVRKIAHTRPLPPDAKIVEKAGRKFAKFRHRGRLIEAPLTKNGKRCRVESECWAARWRDEFGQWQECKAYTDKDASL